MAKQKVQQINQRYNYEDLDITALTAAYHDPNVIWAAPLLVESIGALKEEFLALQPGKKLLLPLNTGNHWVGAMVEKNIHDSFSITWLDSYAPNERIPNATKEFFEQRLDIVLIPKASNINVIQQQDRTSCGPWMIENLKAASAKSLGYQKRLKFSTESIQIKKNFYLI